MHFGLIWKPRSAPSGPCACHVVVCSLLSLSPLWGLIAHSALRSLLVFSCFCLALARAHSRLALCSPIRDDAAGAAV